MTEEQGGRVMVKGSMFVATEKPCVKLEAARKVGYRIVSIAGTRDPIMINQIDEILENILGRVTPMFEAEGIKGRLYISHLRQGRCDGYTGADQIHHST